MTTDTRATAERHPAYPWLIGASLGISAVGLYYLTGYFWAWPWGWQPAVAVWLTVFGGVPVLGSVWDALWLFVAAWNAGAEPDAPEVEKDSPGAVLSPLVGGGLLTEWERYHYDGLLLLFEHARAADSLTSTALIPAAFADGKHWGYWVGVAAANRMCEKSNGVATTLPPNRDYSWAIRRVLNGDFTAPSDLGAPPLPLPHPFRPNLEYKHNAEKAGKAGPKVDMDD